TDSRSSSDVGIRFSCDGARLLVVVACIPKARVASDRVDQMHDASPGHREHVIDPMFMNQVHQIIGQLHHIPSSAHHAAVLRMPSATEISARNPSSCCARAVRGTYRSGEFP